MESITLTYDQIGRPGRPGPDGELLQVRGLRYPVAWLQKDFDKWNAAGFEFAGYFESPEPAAGERHYYLVAIDL